MTTADVLRLGETFCALGAAWLLTYALHSTVLIAGTWAVQRLALVRSLRLRDLLWRGALVGGLLTASLQLGAGLAPWGITLQAQHSAKVPPPPVAAAPLVLEVPAAGPGEEQLGPDVALPPSRAEAGDVAFGVAAVPAAPAAVAVPEVRVHSLLFMAWVAVASVLLLRLAVGRTRVLEGLGLRSPVLEPRLRAQLEALCGEAGRTQPVHLTTAQGLKSPVALGWAEICLPAAVLTELDAPQQRSVLAHELAHLQRRDPLWLLLGTTLEQLLFFQPLNRLVRRNMQEVAEYLCDDWAAVRDGSGLPIARGLAAVARWLDGAEERSVPLAGMAERPSLLVARVQRLLQTHVSLEPRRPWHGLVFALVLLLTVVAVPGVRAAPAAGWFEADPAQATPARATAEAAQTKQTPATAETPATPETAQPPLHRAAHPARVPLVAQVFPAPVPTVPPVPPLPPLPPTASLDAAKLAADMSRHQREWAVHQAALAKMQVHLARAQVSLHQHGGFAHDKGGSSTADEATVQALVKALKDQDAGVREAAAESLGRLSDVRALEGLAAATSDADVAVRTAAVEALGDLDDARAIPALAKALKDASPAVRRPAAEGLAKLEDSPAAVEPLVGALSDSDVHVRLAAATGLAARSDKRALSALEALLKDTSPEVRVEAVGALSGYQDAAIPALTTALKDDSPQVREQAVRALASLSSAQATPALLEATHDKSSDVRAVAAAGLGELPEGAHSAAVVAALKALLDDSSPDVREEAISALGEIRDANALQALIAAMQSKDATVRKAAAAALGQRD